MSNERDELAWALWDHDMAADTTPEWRETAWNDMAEGEDYERDQYEIRADAILAAGYRKPRTITTADELNELPTGSIIRDGEHDAWQRYFNGWHVAGANVFNKKSNVYGETPTLPATVLWEPQP